MQARGARFSVPAGLLSPAANGGLKKSAAAR